ncbi:hypothetical protein KUF71_013423 [Frankliniella fusca]|uniref:Uncharacterized protein n=1 Tax=Frankliniella fusca TaxID=407009 RepID=A0AAE1HPU2_9NEOP|nr:hypothetical protein KUF71_013423 [Frankliniella fusca]
MQILCKFRIGRATSAGLLVLWLLTQRRNNNLWYRGQTFPSVAPDPEGALFWTLQKLSRRRFHVFLHLSMLVPSNSLSSNNNKL